MVPLKAGDGTAFRKLFNFVIKCQIIEVDVTIIVYRHQKLSAPFYQNSYCNFKIDGITSHCSFEENIQKNDLIDLANFVEDEVTFVNDPLYLCN